MGKSASRCATGRCWLLLCLFHSLTLLYAGAPEKHEVSTTPSIPPPLFSVHVALFFYCWGAYPGSSYRSFPLKSPFSLLFYDKLSVACGRHTQASGHGTNGSPLESWKRQQWLLTGRSAAERRGCSENALHWRRTSKRWDTMIPLISRPLS